jgi:hypothetical protein
LIPPMYGYYLRIEPNFIDLATRPESQVLHQTRFLSAVAAGLHGSLSFHGVSNSLALI